MWILLLYMICIQSHAYKHTVICRITCTDVVSCVRWFIMNFLRPPSKAGHVFTAYFLYDIHVLCSTLEWFPWFSRRNFTRFTQKKCRTLESEVPTSLRAGKGPTSELSNWNPEVPFKRLAEWPQWMTLVDLKTWESVQYIVVLDKNTIQVMSYVAGSLFPSSKSLPSPLPHGGFCAALCDPGWKVQLRKVSTIWGHIIS